jgi:prepilin-type N-terminal cleavage/methylation domain-containing protein/prepilin-type processing-associated H-X9-DG protein
MRGGQIGQPGRPGRAQEGMTLMELLAVVAIVSVLAALLFPALALARARAQRTHCSGNFKQLQLAWLMYAQDSEDRVVPNHSRMIGLMFRGTAPSWVLGNARWDRNSSNIEAGLLFPYVKAVAVYHCPADRALAAGSGPRMARLRSYSFDSWFNLDLQGKGYRVEPGYRPGFKTKLGDVHQPGPSQVFGFIDEHQDSIDDGALAVHDPKHWDDPSATSDLKSWMELPSDRHGQGCNLSFIDGHVAHWRWRAPKVFRDYEQPPASVADKADLQQLQGCLPDK